MIAPDSSALPAEDATSLLESEELARVQQNVRLCEDLLKSWAGTHKAYRKELRFNLKLLHYKDQQDPDSEPDRPQPRGRELKQFTKHIAAQISRSKITLDCKGQDKELDPLAAELVKASIERVIYDPEGFYESVLDKVALCGVAARVGVAAVNFEPDLGPSYPFGKILTRWVSSDCVAWHPLYDNPHDLRNPYFVEWVTWDLAELKKVQGLKNLDKLKGSKGDSGTGDSSAPYSVSGATRLADGDSASITPSSELTFVKVAYIWERNVKSKLARLAPADEGARFLKCSACPWESDPQIAQPMDGELPESAPCPMCSGEAKITEGEPTVAVSPYPFGKRLTMLVPDEGVEIFVGPWPQVREPDPMTGDPGNDVRSFPYLVFVPDEFPGEPVGGSMTYDHWTNQLAIDCLMRVGLEHMMLAKPYIALPDGTVKDFEGEPWEFREDQGLGIFYDPMGGGDGIRMIQANGAPAALMPMYELFVNSIRSNSGTGDVALSPDQVKGTTAATLSQAIETGEIPVDHIIQKFRRAQTPFVGVIFDLVRATLTEEQAIRYLNEDGQYLRAAIAGMDLPNADVIVTAEPELQRIDKLEIDAWLAFVMNTPPEFYEFVGKRMRLPMSEVRKLEQASIAHRTRAAEEDDDKSEKSEAAAERQAARNGATKPNGNGATGQQPAIAGRF